MWKWIEALWKPRPLTARDVDDSDPAVRAFVAEAWNRGGHVEGWVDEEGRLHIEGGEAAGQPPDTSPGS